MGAARRAITCRRRWESNPPPMTGRWWSSRCVLAAAQTEIPVLVGAHLAAHLSPPLSGASRCARTL